MKYIFHLIIALLLILILLPILILVTLIISYFDGFPILFKQKRVGKNNNNFFIYKFRTMKNKTPDTPTHLLKNKDENYTIIGPFLRKYSIDELPQLLNIINRDITFIGPRPALFNQSDLIKMRTDRGIHKLMPGITGWAQVNGRDDLSINDKVVMDYFYLKNQSIWLDIKILWQTLLKVVKADGVSV